MHRESGYANVCFWPKADIRTESRSLFLDVCFGEKSGRSPSFEKSQSWKKPWFFHWYVSIRTVTL